MIQTDIRSTKELSGSRFNGTVPTFHTPEKRTHVHHTRKQHFHVQFL